MLQNTDISVGFALHTPQSKLHHLFMIKMFGHQYPDIDVHIWFTTLTVIAPSRSEAIKKIATLVSENGRQAHWELTDEIKKEILDQHPSIPETVHFTIV